MPRIYLNQRNVDESFVHLNRLNPNQGLYAKINEYPLKASILDEAECFFPENYRLMRIDYRLTDHGLDGFEIALLNDKTRSVVYYAQVVEVCRLDAKRHSAVQLLTWKSNSSMYQALVLDLDKKIRYCYLPKHHDVLIGDSARIGEGPQQWRQFMNLALSNRFKVGYLKKGDISFTSIERDGLLPSMENSEPDEDNLLVGLISRMDVPTHVKVRLDG